MLTAIDVEHPTVQQALNTDEGFQCSSEYDSYCMSHKNNEATWKKFRFMELQKCVFLRRHNCDNGRLWKCLSYHHCRKSFHSVIRDYSYGLIYLTFIDQKHDSSKKSPLILNRPKGIPGFGFLLSKIGDGLMHWVENCERSLFGKRRRTQYRVTVFIM